MIEIGDASLKIDAADRLTSHPSQPILNPESWVTRLAVTTTAPQVEKSIAETDVRGAVELIDGERSTVGGMSVRAAFEAWQAGAGEGTRAELVGLIGRETTQRARSFVAEVKPGLGRALFG